MLRELIVPISATNRPSISTWEAAIRAAGFRIELDTNVNLNEHWGWLPASFPEHTTGCEVGIWNIYVEEIYPRMTQVGLRGSHDVMVLSWDDDLWQCATACTMAAALAAMTNSVIYDPHNDVIYDDQTAIQIARDVVDEAIQTLTWRFWG